MKRQRAEGGTEGVVLLAAEAEVQAPPPSFGTFEKDRHPPHFLVEVAQGLQVRVVPLAFVEPFLLARMAGQHGDFAVLGACYIDKNFGFDELPQRVAVGIGLGVVDCDLVRYGGPRRIEYAARDLGASTLRVLISITAPMIAPALIAAFCLCFTLSWDETLIALLNTRFEVTLPVVILSLMRGGINPETNAAGSFIFLCSILLMIVVELSLLRRRR